VFSRTLFRLKGGYYWSRVKKHLDQFDKRKDGLHEVNKDEINPIIHDLLQELVGPVIYSKLSAQ